MSGHYCLSEDITDSVSSLVGLIKIKASDVELDLNGNQLQATYGEAIVLDSTISMSNVIIRNGFISASDDSSAPSGTGIYKEPNGQSASNVQLYDLTIYGCGSHGLSLENVDGLIVNNCVVRNNAANGLSLVNCDNVVIRSSKYIHNGGEAGAFFEEVPQVLIEETEFFENEHSGVTYCASSDAADLVLRTVVANNNERGVRFNSVGGIVAERCVFNNNSLSGFTFYNNILSPAYFDIDQATESLVFKNCVANGNGETPPGSHGFRFGYQSYSRTLIKSAVVDSCAACENAGDGFSFKNS